MLKYTKEQIINEAKKYTNRKEFELKSNSFYQASRRYGVHKEACKHMEFQEEYWSKEKIIKIIDSCITHNEFRIKYVNAYEYSKRYDLLEYAQDTLIQVRKIWNKSKFNKEIRKYNTIAELIKGSGGAYKWAKRNNIKINLDHKARKNIIYTPEKIREIASRCSTREEFKTVNMAATARARKIGIFEDVCRHMKRGPYGFNPEMPGKLYYLRVRNDLYKIGITNHSVEYRYKNSTKDREMIKVIKEWDFENGYKCAAAEKKILKDFAFAKYDGDDVLESNGNTELFKYDILGEDYA